MQPVFDQDLALQDFPCLGNVSVHRSQGSDAKEDDGWQLLDKMPAPGLRRSSSRSSFPARPSLC